MEVLLVVDMQEGEHHHWIWTQLFAQHPVRLAPASEV
jgi:hypothetical protein